jgi:hypothetical protein
MLVKARNRAAIPNASGANILERTGAAAKLINWARMEPDIRVIT